MYPCEKSRTCGSSGMGSEIRTGGRNPHRKVSDPIPDVYGTTHSCYTERVRNSGNGKHMILLGVYYENLEYYDRNLTKSAGFRKFIAVKMSS